MKKFRQELIATSAIVERLNSILKRIEDGLYSEKYDNSTCNNNDIAESARLIKALLDKFDEIDDLLRIEEV